MALALQHCIVALSQHTHHSSPPQTTLLLRSERAEAEKAERAARTAAIREQLAELADELKEAQVRVVALLLVAAAVHTGIGMRAETAF